MADKDLYKACAVEVKRQIWQDNQALFGDEVSPLLKQYILEKENILFSNDISVLHNFFSPSPKTRRQGEVRTRKPLTTCLSMEFIGFQPASSSNSVLFTHPAMLLKLFGQTKHLQEVPGWFLLHIVTKAAGIILIATQCCVIID